MSTFIIYQEITSEKALVTYIDNDPSRLNEVTLSKGIIVDSIPASEPVPFKYETLYYNPITERFFYEYIDRPLSSGEEVEQLKNENADLWYDIMLKESRIDEHDNDIADVWYEIMTGGAA